MKISLLLLQSFMRADYRIAQANLKLRYESDFVGRTVPMSEKLSARLFCLDSNIRYVAINQGGRIVEMEQNPKRPSLNPTETDRMEELIVNPILLELTRRRGNLDMNGMRYVVVRYGTMYEVIFPFKDGHLSIGVELDANPTEVAESVAKCLGLAA